MKCEVVEIKSGARMSYQAGKGAIMGTTVFDSPDAAKEWMIRNDLTGKTHKVVPVS